VQYPHQKFLSFLQPPLCGKFNPFSSLTMFSPPQMLENWHFENKYQILEKSVFGHRISYHVDCKILVFELTKYFSWPFENWQLHFTRSHLYENIFQMVVLIWIHSSRQVDYVLEKIQIIWNCTVG